MTARTQLAFRRSLTLFLFGPVIATLHFLSLYLFAETACTAGWLASRLLGISGLGWVTVIVTVVAALTSSMMSVRAWRERAGRFGDLASTGSILGVVFTIAILFVGIPVAVLDPC